MLFLFPEKQIRQSWRWGVTNKIFEQNLTYSNKGSILVEIYD